MSLSLITLFSCLLLVSHPVIRLHQLLAECSITFYNALENKLIHSLAQFSSSRDHFWGWSLKFVLTPAGLLSAVSFSGSGLWFSLLFSQNYLLLLIMHRQNLQSFWETSRCKLPTYSVSNKMSSFGDLKSSLFLRNASPPGEKKKKSLNHCSGHWARVTASNLLNLPSWLRTLILLSSWDEDD